MSSNSQFLVSTQSLRLSLSNYCLQGMVLRTPEGLLVDLGGQNCEGF